MQEVIDNSGINEVQSSGAVRTEVKKIISLDFNCDLAQSFGIYKNEGEFELLDWVSSVNIATGFHAGDPIAIKNALVKASEKNVVIGAHIGFNDIQGFGAREVRLTEEETEALVVYQVGALMSFAKACGLEVEHVRPHGAMYRLAAENFAFSCAIAKAVKKCSKWLTYVGATGDVIEKVGDYVKIPIAKEIKLNKVYNADLTVDYRSEEIKDVDLQVRRLQGVVKSFQIGNNASGFSPVEADTIHFTSDSLEVIKRAHEIISPKPVNYAKVESSGWV